MIIINFKFLPLVLVLLSLGPLFAFENYELRDLTEQRSHLPDLAKPQDSSKKRQFFNIAHATNLKESVDLAILSRANALEMDLQFDEKKGGIPTAFHHGLPCECACAPLVLLREKIRDKRTASLCSKVSSPCTESTPVRQMFQYISRNYSNKVSFIYIDGKVSQFKNRAFLKNAGKNIFNIVKEALFNSGYKGQIVFGVPRKEDIDYLKSIYDELKQEENATFLDRVFFTIDWEEMAAASLLKFMVDSGITSNRIYAIGNSICTPTRYYRNTIDAYRFLLNGTIGLNIIWTLDRASSIHKYIRLGANAVISNSPKKVYEIATRLGYTISPENRISINR